MYTIKEVAEKMDISEHTLRFWAKSGFFPFITRDKNNIRQFSEKDLDWVKIVKCLRSVGTENKAIKKYIDLCIIGDSTIKENRKNPLIWNYVISTAATLGGGYFVDRVIKNNTQNFVDKFAKLNKSDPKLAKYIEGINILRPAIIFAGIYYMLLPVISTYLAEKIDKKL